MQLLWKVLLYALGGYLAICVLAFLFQRKMLYLPSGGSLSVDQATENGMVHWPSTRAFVGYLCDEIPDDAKGTVVVFHGNAGAAYHRDFYAEALSRQGLRVILAEYPGYGGRSGRPSEEALVRDALETIRFAHREFGEPLYLWGESLGCGVVAGALKATDIPIPGVVLFTPWDSLPALAQTHYPILPARWLVRDHYDNVENLKGYGGKVAVILAGRDEVVPVRHGQKLYGSIAAKKKLWLFEGASHNAMPVSPELSWWNEVVAFVSQ
jgi:alpha-beta hydrolase superfamily lysophospholipase